VQVDCPEDADTYIHRVGRTARFQKAGRAVLFLEPSEEEGFLKRLESKKVPIEPINVRQKKKQSIADAVANLCFKDPQLKYLGQKAFTSYVRSVYLQSDKEVFQLEKLPLEEFASSLGLPGAPRIKFLKADSGEMKNRKNAPRHVAGIESSDEENDGREADVAKTKKLDTTIRTKYDRMFERRNQDVLAEHYSRLVREDEDLSSHASEDREDQIDGLDGEQAPDDTFLTVKRRITADDDIDMSAIPADKREKKLVYISGAKAPLLIDSKRAEKRLKSKKKLLKYKEKGSRLTFDDEGKAHPVYELVNEENWRETGKPEDQRRVFVQGEREKLKVVDVGDKAIAKAKKREKLAKRREREKRETEGEDMAAQHGGIELKDAREDFLRDAEVISQSDEDRVDEPPAKRKRKWFEENRNEKRNTVDEAETLEDLEAMAKGLLG
jgi:ATP-dependent RNA helicase DDX10/DBP4